MMAFASLWLPIVVSAVAVFFGSSIINAALPWHKNDFEKVPDEDAFMNAVRPMGIARGEYLVPKACDRKEMQSPEFAAKMKQGPVMIMTVMPGGPPSIGQSLWQWALYCIFVSSMAACLACMILPRGADGYDVFHYTAFVAFLSYVVALWQSSIWYWRPWKTTLKSTLDGVIYALITGGIFMLLWPK